jgi:hypothetical protein
MTLNFHGIPYQEIALDACLPMAERFQTEGRRWHIHVLSPGCLHNPFGEDYALVIEDDTTSTPYIANSGAGFPEVDKVLVKMLHGDDILDAPVAHPDAGARSSRLLAHLRGLQDNGEPWHHHMHFPTCVFNPHAGHWAISIESPGLVFAESFAEEPVAVLREVEVLYFRNLASAD